MLAEGWCATLPPGQFEQDRRRTRLKPRISILGAGIAGASAAYHLVKKNKKVVILDFWNDTPIQQPTLGGFAADELRRDLFVTQRMILPTDLRTDLSTRLPRDPAGLAHVLACIVAGARRYLADPRLLARPPIAVRAALEAAGVTVTSAI